MEAAGIEAAASAPRARLAEFRGSLAAAGDGPLEARTRELSRGRKLATYEVRVLDSEERQIAAFQATAYSR